MSYKNMQCVILAFKSLFLRQNLSFSLILFDMSMYSCAYAIRTLCLKLLQWGDSSKMSRRVTIKVAISNVCNASDCGDSTLHLKLKKNHHIFCCV